MNKPKHYEAKDFARKFIKKKTRKINSMLGTESLSYCDNHQKLGQAAAVLFTQRGCSHLKQWVNTGNLALEFIKLFTYTALLELAWIHDCTV